MPCLEVELIRINDNDSLPIAMNGMTIDGSIYVDYLTQDSPCQLFSVTITLTLCTNNDVITLLGNFMTLEDKTFNVRHFYWL